MRLVDFESFAKPMRAEHFRVLRLPLNEEIPHCQNCIKGKIYTFWYFLGRNEFLMTVSIISKWFDHLSRANCFGF